MKILIHSFEKWSKYCTQNNSEGQRAQHTACLKTQTNTHENMFISYKTPVLAKPWLSVVNIKYSKACATFTFTSTKLNFKTREL